MIRTKISHSLFYKKNKKMNQSKTLKKKVLWGVIFSKKKMTKF
jgi:hypothetical protein